MDGSMNGDAKDCHPAAQYGGDPLAIAMAQSGIQLGGDAWQMVALESQSEPARQLQSGAADVTSDASRAGDVTRVTAAGDGDMDSWLSSYYYTVADDDDDGEEQNDDARTLDDPDEPSARPGRHAGTVASQSLLSRLMLDRCWTGRHCRRPPYTYEQLAALAVCSSPSRRLSTPHMADFVRRVYPFFRKCCTPLETLLEEAVVASACFRRRVPPGRCWTVTAEAERRIIDTLRPRGGSAGAGGRQLPTRPAWQEDHNYAAVQPTQTVTVRRRVKLATKT